MAILVEVEQVGEDLAIILPEEILAHLNASLGGSLELVTIPNGLLIRGMNQQPVDYSARSGQPLCDRG